MPRQRCVGGVVWDGAGRLLMVSRTTDPDEGPWVIPGGRVEPGETDAEALARELREETGLLATVGDHVGTVDVAGPGGVVYEIHDYQATVVGGTLRAGDDAALARWISPAEIRTLPCVPGLLQTLTEWGVLPP